MSDVFKQAFEKAAFLTLDKLKPFGFQKLIRNGGSPFRLAVKNEKPEFIILLSVFIEPNIQMELDFRDRDIQELAEFIKQNLNIYCYHYHFDKDLSDTKSIERQVILPSEIVDFLEANQVIVHYKKN